MNKGLTLVEVIFSLALIGVLIAVFAGSLSGTLGVTENTGSQGQASQLLSQLSRKIVDSDPTVLTEQDVTKSWDYGTLSAAFPGLSTNKGLSDLAKYRADIEINGTTTVANTSISNYVITICYETDREQCYSTNTFGYTTAQEEAQAPDLPEIY